MSARFYSQQLGCFAGVSSHPVEVGDNFRGSVAERVGFEPTVGLRPRRISSAVLSTTQPPLRGFGCSPDDPGFSVGRGP